MSSKNVTGSRTLWSGGAFNPCSVTFVLLFLLFTAVPVNATIYAYSDAWISDAGVPEGTTYEPGDERAGPYIYGAGVTYINYSSYGHQAVARTALISPDSRRQDASAFGPGTYARAEAKLLWNPYEAGDFSVGTTHIEFCPYNMNGYTPVMTGIPIFIGTSANAMRRVSPGSGAFATIEPCSVICHLSGLVSRDLSFPYATVFVPFTQFRCLRGSFVIYHDVPSACADYYTSFSL
jgi:hypothetical protein